jgi:hypothetical protein
VLLDATVVRMVFVPAALAVLGARAWRLSPRLDRVLPDLDIEGHRLSHRTDEFGHVGHVGRVHQPASGGEPLSEFTTTR